MSKTRALLRLWTARADLRARIHGRALELDSFRSGLTDLGVEGSWTERQIRTRDLGPTVREWREGVNSLTSGAAQIGDRKLSRLVEELAQWREPFADVLATFHESGERPAIDRPEGARTINEIVPEVIARLGMLTRRARWVEFWIAPILVVIGAAVAGAAAGFA